MRGTPASHAGHLQVGSPATPTLAGRATPRLAKSFGDWAPPILFVRFPEPPAAGNRFTYRGIVWELTKETGSYENLWIEGKRTTWEARVARPGGGGS